VTACVIVPIGEKGWGRIINVASALGLIASPFKAAYVAAKHGTPRDDVIRNALLAGQLNKRFATVEEVGGSGIAVFLTSEAATSITGTTISADGGLTAR
jgi:3-hydroxybutyrate dehydrogenase